MNRFLKYTHILLIPLICLAGCSDELNVPLKDSGMTSDAYFIISYADGTRTSYSDVNHTEFENGDIVGGFALDADGNAVDGQPLNVKYTVVSKESLTGNRRQILEAVDKTQELGRNMPKYLFYYPYNEKIKSLDDLKDYDHTVSDDQSGRNTFCTSDLLWDVATPDKTLDCVNIAMDHAMAQIIVEIDEKLIKKESSVILNGVLLTAKGIDLTTPSVSDLTYNTSEPRKDISMWNFGYGTSGNLQFRAAVPAFTIDGDKAFMTLTDTDGNQKQYKLKESLTLEPGKNYVFRLVKDDIYIPEIGDDDSWVLDVLDPETGESVGVLCREYIRYQPGLSDNYKPDLITGTDAENSDGTPTKNISSQAWVFYALKDKTNKIPDLNNGTVLRFIYDLNYNTNSEKMGTAPENCAHTWPAPHHYGIKNGQVAQGLYLPDHGHIWSWSESGGISSEKWTEYFMHGGKLHWSDYVIDKFSMPLQDDGISPLQITNEIALKNGHIAIDAKGNATVSYDEIKEDGIYDINNKKVGVLISHYLIDSRGNEITKYPLVKIGYNNFWISKDFRATSYSDGTPLVCYNNPDAENGTIISSYKYGDPVLKGGYLFPRVKTTEYEHDCYKEFNGTVTDETVLLYNSTCIESDQFLPISKDGRFIYRMPSSEVLIQMRQYFGAYFITKLLSRHIMTRYSDKLSDSPETFQEAVDQHKNIDNTFNLFSANISGFNLLPYGYFEAAGPANGFVGLCSIYRLWMAPENGIPYYFEISAHHVWAPKPEITDALIQSWWFSPEKSQESRMFYPIRLLSKFVNQDDTGESRSFLSIYQVPTLSMPEASPRTITVTLTEM